MEKFKEIPKINTITTRVDSALYQKILEYSKQKKKSVSKVGCDMLNHFFENGNTYVPQPETKSEYYKHSLFLVFPCDSISFAINRLSHFCIGLYAETNDDLTKIYYFKNGSERKKYFSDWHEKVRRYTHVREWHEERYLFESIVEKEVFSSSNSCWIDFDEFESENGYIFYIVLLNGMANVFKVK